MHVLSSMEQEKMWANNQNAHYFIIVHTSEATPTWTQNLQVISFQPTFQGKHVLTAETRFHASTHGHITDYRLRSFQVAEMDSSDCFLTIRKNFLRCCPPTSNNTI